jgi:hypothetical protein
MLVDPLLHDSRIQTSEEFFVSFSPDLKQFLVAATPKSAGLQSFLPRTFCPTGRIKSHRFTYRDRRRTRLVIALADQRP